MHSTIALAIGSAAVLTLICTGIALFLRRRAIPTPSPTSPTSTAASPAQYKLFYPTIDEWEAQAPYPDHALHALRHTPPASSLTSDFPARSSPDAFSDDGERLEPEPYQRRFGSPPRGETLAPPSSLSTEPRPSPTAAAEPDHFSYAPSWATETLASSSDTHYCPQCGSTRVDVLNVGRKAGSTLGSVAGATSGVAMALSGAEAGAAVGAIGGPLGAVFGGLTGAVIAGLLGSAAGSIAGSTVGGVLDDSLLDNYRCLSCGHTFGAQYR